MSSITTKPIFSLPACHSTFANGWWFAISTNGRRTDILSSGSSDLSRIPVRTSEENPREAMIVDAQR
jgi:hypothetical protein